mgnify:CR=1 FL=1
MTDIKYIVVDKEAMDITNELLKEANQKNEEFKKQLEAMVQKSANPEKEAVIAKREAFANLAALKDGQVQKDMRSSLEASYKAKSEEKAARQRIIEAHRLGKDV